MCLHAHAHTCNKFLPIFLSFPPLASRLAFRNSSACSRSTHTPKLSTLQHTHGIYPSCLTRRLSGCGSTHQTHLSYARYVSYNTPKLFTPAGKKFHDALLLSLLSRATGGRREDYPAGRGGGCHAPPLSIPEAAATLRKLVQKEKLSPTPLSRSPWFIKVSKYPSA